MITSNKEWQCNVAGSSYTENVSLHDISTCLVCVCNTRTRQDPSVETFHRTPASNSQDKEQGAQGSEHHGFELVKIDNLKEKDMDAK